MKARESGPILLVEDDEVLAGLLEHHLRAHGYEVQTAPSAEDAGSLISSAAPPWLVLLDINLPGETGWSLLRTGPLAAPGHPDVVVMTSLTVSPRRLDEFDVAGYLPKPFPMETLLATVERLAAGRSLEEVPSSMADAAFVALVLVSGVVLIALVHFCDLVRR